MELYAVYKPGRRAKSQNRQLSWHVCDLEKHYVEAHLALSLFQAVCPDTEGRAQRTAAYEAEAKVSVYGDLPAFYATTRAEALEGWYRVRQEVRDRGGDIGSILKTEPLFHARSFLYCLDNFAKLLEVMTKELHAPAALDSAFRVLEAGFPNLVAIRNSAHHMEDRSRGLKTGGKPIFPKTEEAIEGGRLRILMVDGLMGTNYSCTMADGELGQVDVSGRSLKVLQQVFQEVLDGFDWIDDMWEVLP